jgi:prevent-host-death family protein
MTWNLSEAKNRLSEVLRRAETEAQRIVRRDRDYVLMTGEEYRKLKGQEASFTAFLIDGGPRSDEFEPMKRAATPMRDPEL